MKKQPKAKIVTIRARVTAEQKSAFEFAAAQEGLDLSNWLRWIAVNAARPELRKR